MKKIYELYKNMVFHYPELTGVLVGYSDDKFILSISAEPTPSHAFKRVDKGMTINPDYVGKGFTYCWIDERKMEQELAQRKYAV